MRFLPTRATIILATLLPLVAAVPQAKEAKASAMSASAAGASTKTQPLVEVAPSRMNYTQFANITEPARNTTGLLMSIMEGSIQPFNGKMGGSASIDWADDKKIGHVGGGWTFGAAEYGGGGGGWKFNATTFEYGGGVALNKDTTKADYLVQVSTDGSIKMTFSTTQDMTCTTTPAKAGTLAKTECVVLVATPKKAVNKP